jgi:hypothetical protein
VLNQPLGNLCHPVRQDGLCSTVRTTAYDQSEYLIWLEMGPEAQNQRVREGAVSASGSLKTGSQSTE